MILNTILNDNHSHCHIYIYIYIEREREREREKVDDVRLVSKVEGEGVKC